VFFGLNNLWLGKENSDLRARIPANINIVNLEGTTNAPGSTGYLMVFKNENVGVLAVEDIPVLDTKHQYQLWLVRDGKRSNGGVFSVSQNGYGTLRIMADQPLANFQSFGITVEPWGGSPQPTGKKVLGTKL
jgi:anti-sigma-K factor RskA